MTDKKISLRHIPERKESPAWYHHWLLRLHLCFSQDWGKV